MVAYKADWRKLRRFCANLLMKEGMCESDAIVCADSLVDADLSGVESHGVSRLTNYMKRLRTQVVSHESNYTVEKEYPGSLLVDGNNAMGMAVGKFTMTRCIEKASENGSCFAAVKHSNHYGTASYYARMAAEKGMIGITGTNAPPNIAPWGSSQKYMGTNPIAIAVPTDQEPMVLDMAPSVVAMGKIILAAKLGKSIPEGWVLDPDGKPTTDPQVGQYGTLIPIGGPKGSGIAIMMEVLCGVLSGAEYGPHINHFWKDFEHPQNLGHFFAAIDVDKFCGICEFRQRVGNMIREMKALPLSPGSQQIYMPGEIESIRREERKKNGIELSESVYQELKTLAEQYNVKFEL